MIKNWKTGLLWGFLLWIFIFVEWSILIFLPWVKDHKFVQWIIHFIVLIFLVIICVSQYFKKVKATTKEGFLVGVYFLIIGNVLDLIITVPLFIKSYGLFYSSWPLWLGFLELIVVSTLVGYWKGKK